MTIALMIIADGAVQTHVFRRSDGLTPSQWALARMGSGDYFGRLGGRDILDLGYHGIYRMHSSAGEGVVMVAP